MDHEDVELNTINMALYDASAACFRRVCGTYYGMQDVMQEERRALKPSAKRDTKLEENLRLFDLMLKGDKEVESYCLRAKIDYASVNGKACWRLCLCVCVCVYLFIKLYIPRRDKGDTLSICTVLVCVCLCVFCVLLSSFFFEREGVKADS